jgi:N-acetyltransferase
MRTYSSRKRAAQVLDEHDPDLETSASSSLSMKVASSSCQTAHQELPRKRPKNSPVARPAVKEAKPKQKTMVQLHFCIDKSIIKKCLICGLCYTQGAQEDMRLHRTHCNRVQKGLEWGKEEEREGYGSLISEIESRVMLANKKAGRIIAFPCDVTGKLGAKVRKPKPGFVIYMLLNDTNHHIALNTTGDSQSLLISACFGADLPARE